MAREPAASKASGKSRKGLYVLLAGIVIIAAVLAAGYFLRGGTGHPGNGILAGESPVLGSLDAKVTIIEYSDFECPYCGRFALDTFPLIKANYIDTGKVKFVFRNYIVHPDARLSAEASLCAYEQGNDKYWAYNDILFRNQGSLDSASLKTYASGLGLDTAKFNACLDDGKYGAQVDKDMQDGKAAGVGGTPTFFVNGSKIVGAQPYEIFRQTIEAALNA
jgi:protein-disulfide isomerase